MDFQPCQDASNRRHEPLIELRGVSKAFGEHLVLDRVDLQIYRGEALAVIGPSGTGKSTILRIIAGLLSPDEGEVYVCGQKRQGIIEDVSDPITIGMVFQQAALFDSLTVEENVGFMLHQYSKLPPHEIRRLVEGKLEMVGLPADTCDRYPAELSGGMRKRVSFARAIMVDPKSPSASPEMLLYDEPTAGLDPIASTVIEDLIRQLQRAQGGCGTYVMVTHQDSTIRRTSDRIVFLYHGQVQWQGTVLEMEEADHPMIQQFRRGMVDGPIQLID